MYPKAVSHFNACPANGAEYPCTCGANRANNMRENFLVEIARRDEQRELLDTLRKIRWITAEKDKRTYERQLETGC